MTHSKGDYHKSPTEAGGTPHNTYPSPLLIACSDLEGRTPPKTQLQNKTIHFTTSVLKLQVTHLFTFAKSVEAMNTTAGGKKSHITIHFIILSTNTEAVSCVFSHTPATGEITALAMHPVRHYFCYSVNSGFLLIKLDQVCPPAGTRTDGNSSILQGRLGLVAGSLLQWSHIRGCCAILFMPNTPSGVGVISLINSKTVRWRSSFIIKKLKLWLFSLKVKKVHAGNFPISGVWLHKHRYRYRMLWLLYNL